MLLGSKALGGSAFQGFMEISANQIAATQQGAFSSHMVVGGLINKVKYMSMYFYP